MALDYSALFKEVFGDKPVEAIPDFGILIRDIPFSSEYAIGNRFEVPVALSDEAGFTFASYSDDTSGVTLNAAAPGTLLQAQVQGSTIYLRSQIGTLTLQRAAAAGKKAFASALTTLYSSMVRAMTRRLEATMLLGGCGLGVVSGNSTGVLTITDASWAPGIWCGAQGTVLEAFTATSGGSQHNGDLTISAVNYTNKTITVTGTSSSVVANDYLFYKGARGKEQLGIKYILTHSGTVFNIDNSAYDLWAGKQHAVGGAVSRAEVLKGAAKAVNGGLLDPANLYISPVKFAVLLEDEATLVRHSGKETDMPNGASGIEYAFVNGKITVKSHPMVPEGEAFLFNPKQCLRIGATDMTFKRPGRQDDVYLEVANSPSTEIRMMADCQVFLKLPAQAVWYNGIT